MRTSVPNFTLKQLLGDYWDPISTILRLEKEAQKEAAKEAVKKEDSLRSILALELLIQASKRGLSGVEASSSGASDPKASKRGLSWVEASSSEPKIN